MANPNKRRGDVFEIAVCEHCCGAGFSADRTRAGYARDHGDIHLASGPAGPAVILQCKNHARIDLAGWLDDLAEQVEASGAEHGALVVKRRGVGNPGRSYVVMELDPWLVLADQAGYGITSSEEIAS